MMPLPDITGLVAMLFGIMAAAAACLIVGGALWALGHQLNWANFGIVVAAGGLSGFAVEALIRKAGGK